MPRYLVTAKWNAAGAAGTRSEGFAKRAEMTRGLWESLGAKVECVYYAPGTSDFDVLGIIDGASSDAIFAAVNKVLAGGTVERGSAVELRTPEEADAAVAMDITYRPAGAS